MTSALGAVTARPHLHPAVALALPAATARKFLFRSRAASTMDAASASSPGSEKTTTTVFVAGSTGRTGKRVVEKLLAKGFGVVAGTTDLQRARGSLPQDPNLRLVSLSCSACVAARVKWASFSWSVVVMGLRIGVVV